MKVGWQSHTQSYTQSRCFFFIKTVTVCISEDESEEDEADIISREALKRQSQLIVDSKSKKKPWKKKKGKF